MSRALSIAIIMAFALLSCSRKHHPERSTTAANEKISTVNRNDSLLAKKTVVKPTKKDIIPRVITVNDNAAHKSVDGRYYYDLLGHRYWKNNKDGKYYLFNKSMYNNDAFKAPSK